MVVSIANITPVHGSRYYAQDGNTVESKQISSWRGRLAKVLGLSIGHPVDPATLTALLQGKTATGLILLNKTRLHHEQDNAKASGQKPATERAGLDLTASAPKSVSIQALVFDDLALIMAHQTAIAQMLQILEERYAMTRITTHGERQKIITGKLLIAQFQHHTSRALDPQLHTHNLILNLTQRPDGRWQCLDNEAIYRTKMLLGLIYRNQLAREVQALGYAIQITQARHGLWELQGFSAQQLAQFSQRSEQIKAAAGAAASSERKAKATIFSGRAQKQVIAADQLADAWQQQAHANGLNAITPGPPKIPLIQQLWEIAQGLVQRAIAFCARIAQFFRREDLEKAAMRAGIGQTDFATIAQAIDQSPELIVCRDQKHRIRYTRKGDGFDDPIPTAPPAHRPETPTHGGESPTRNHSQSAQTSNRRLFAAFHVRPNRQAAPVIGEPEATHIDCGEPRDRRPDQSLDATASAFAQGHDDAVRAIADDPCGTDDGFEYSGREGANIDQNHARFDSTANANRRDAAVDRAPASQCQPDSVDDWEPSL